MRKITLAVAALAAVAVLSGCSKKDEKYSEAKRFSREISTAGMFGKESISAIRPGSRSFPFGRV